MDNARPLISLCIPTYKQSKRLEMLLQCLASQSLEGIEIIIRDDSPDQDTEHIVARHERALPIRYYHGERLGFDNAIIFLVQHAHGRYLWFFGDDLMVPGSVKKVAETLRITPGLSFLYVNARNSGDQGALAFFYKNDFFFYDKQQAISELSDLLSFPSALVLDRERTISGILGAQAVVGTALVHFYLALHVLSQDGRYYFIQTPLILTEPKLPEHAQWYDTFRVFAIEIYKIAKTFEPQFGKRAIKKMLAQNFHGIWKGIIVYRARGFTHGLGSPKVTVREIAKYYWSFPDFWLALPLLLLPRKVLSIFYYFFCTFFRKNRT